MILTNLKTIESKLILMTNEGKVLFPKQIGYVDNHYDITSDELEQITYHWSADELVLYAPVKVLKSLDGIAGYDFSVESAEMYLKINDDALMITWNSEDIQFFKEVFIDSINCEDFDNEGNFIEEE